MLPTFVDTVQVHGSNSPDAMLTRTFLSSNDLLTDRVRSTRGGYVFSLSVSSHLGGGGVPTFPGLDGGVPTFPGLEGGDPTFPGLEGGGVPTFPGLDGGTYLPGLDGGVPTLVPRVGTPLPRVGTNPPRVGTPPAQGRYPPTGTA